MLNIEKFFDDLSFALYSRPKAFEAALTSGAQEHWLATEAAILLHEKREDYGIGGVLSEHAPCIPNWWVAREAGLVDLFVAPEKIKDSENSIGFAFEFKVIRSESYKYRRQLDDLRWQISGIRKAHKNYCGIHVNWYGIVLAFDNHYTPGYARVKKAESLYGSNAEAKNFFDVVWGEADSYKNWVVRKCWEVWSCKSSDFRQYLDVNKESSVKIFLIQGKVSGGGVKKSIPRSSDVPIRSANFITS
ncbi:hypothetical protein [Azospirillum largimobile]